MPFPRQIQLQTQNLCNMACSCCPYPKMKKSIKKESISSTKLKQLLKEIGSNDFCKEIVLDLQNEPLIDKNLKETIRLAKKYSKNRLKVGITTNGSLLTDNVFFQLIEAGLDTMVVSFNAFSAETYNKIENEKVFKKIKEFCDHHQKSSVSEKITLSFGVNKYNMNEVDDFIDYCNQGHFSYRVFLLHDRLGVLSKNDFISKVSKENFCELPLASMAILVNGDVILCCQDWSKTLVLGNVFEQSVSDVWNSGIYSKIRENAFFNNRLPSQPCSSCNHKIIYKPSYKETGENLLDLEHIKSKKSSNNQKIFKFDHKLYLADEKHNVIEINNDIITKHNLSCDISMGELNNGKITRFNDIYKSMLSEVKKKYGLEISRVRVTLRKSDTPSITLPLVGILRSHTQLLNYENVQIEQGDIICYHFNASTVIVPVEVIRTKNEKNDVISIYHSLLSAEKVYTYVMQHC